MTDKPRDENRSTAAEPNTEQDAREERDELARRRELMRQAQLTNREREQRWPIG
jgi:hypothetical protein